MEPSSANVIDLAVLAVILLSGLLALIRGFVREVVALATWSGAGVVTVYLYPVLRPWMHEHIKSSLMADIATGLALFCVALAIFIPLGHLLSSLVRGRTLTAVDRSLGFVFGLARGFLVVCLLFLLSLWLWPTKEKEPDVLAQAKSRPILALGAQSMDIFLPKDDIAKVTDTLHALDDNTPALDQLTTPAIAGSTDDATAKAETSSPSPSSTPPATSDNVHLIPTTQGKP
jgi:membrane protein required for colicin V production